MCMSKILGIDLGGESVVIPNAEGARTTPSVVAFTKTGERVVGQAAKRQAVTNPKNTFFSAKRFIGRKFSEVKAEAANMPFKVVEGKNGDAYIEVQVGDKTETFAPQQIAAFVLGKLKTDAEAYLGEKVTQGRHHGPAYFNDAQRQATKDAGKIAGLEVMRIINEPTAASLAYGLDKKKDEKIAVFDLGGGTFDVSVLEIGDGVFEVKATNGDTHLGGRQLGRGPHRLARRHFQKGKRHRSPQGPDGPPASQGEAEKGKIALSSATTYDINPAVHHRPTPRARSTSTCSWTRAKMEQICDSLFERCIQPFKNCLKDSGVSSDKIDELVLVGGMTRMPKVVEIARQLGGKDPAPGRQPGRSRRHRRGRPGRRPQGEVRDVLLLDVTPADPRHHDRGRRPPRR